MNIVIISEYSARELYIIEQILKEYPSATVVRPTYPSDSPKSRKSPIDKLPGIRKWTDALVGKARYKLWERKFYPDNEYPDITNIIEIPESELHESSGIQTFEILSPDILITCRAPIISRDLINIPDIAAINIHYGIAPDYRGNDTLFWPLYFNDFDKVGGCIHHLTEGIDTGNILAEVYPSLSPCDGEIEIDYKTSRLLAIALLKFLKYAERNDVNLSGKPQLKKGQNYNRDKRTFTKSLGYVLKRAVGLSSPPRRNSRINNYFSSQTSRNPAPPHMSAEDII